MSESNEYGVLQRVLLGRPRDLFRSEQRISEQWRQLHFTAAPDLSRAIDQHYAFEAIVKTHAAEIHYLSDDDDALTLDAIYVRDASMMTPRGAVLCRMGKPARQSEPHAHARAFAAIGVEILGAIEPPGRVEGGDVVWFDERTLAIGRGYRTNDDGIRQLDAILGDVDIQVVPLPHFRGPGDVFHLMSIISPVAGDVAVVYSPLMPVPFREWLCRRGIRFVEVPDEEFASMGANVLAVGPHQAVMLDGNPVTRARLEAAGTGVDTYDGSEISVKGGGGPTCLTRPLTRAAS